MAVFVYMTGGISQGCTHSPVLSSLWFVFFWRKSWEKLSTTTTRPSPSVEGRFAHPPVKGRMKFKTNLIQMN